MSDTDEMLTVLADDVLYEFTGGEAPTRDVLERRYRRQLDGPNRPGEQWLNWIIRTKTDQRAVGFVQASVVGDGADVAWLVGLSDQGRGIASEAALAMCDWLETNGIKSLNAHIHSVHVGSRRIAKRLGMSSTGMVDEEGEEIWTRRSSSLGSVGDE